MYRFLNKELESSALSGELCSPSQIYHIRKSTNYLKWMMGILGLLILGGFLPWTQNIRSKGFITSLNQADRPQEINAVVPGKIDKWYVREGDFVKKGDTILTMSEVKAEYFDPNLIERTRNQILAKNQSQAAYSNKAEIIDNQLAAINETRNLKLNAIDNKILQQKSKIAADSIDKIAAQSASLAYDRQYFVAKTLLDSGAISITEFEKRKLAAQDGKAKMAFIDNKLLQGKQELNILRIEKNAANQDFIDKSSKARGDQFAAISDINTATTEILKLENLLANYNVRSGLFTVTAPQDGQVSKVLKEGIGEVIKEGEIIAIIVPKQSTKAIEMYVEPVDLPLITLGQKIRFVFDGYPAIVFSGWPKGSFGTFGGKVVAIENAASTDGKFRILVAEDKKEKPWPTDLRIGGGANGIALLKNVSVFYELWRNINGFPPEYYVRETSNDQKK